MITALLKRPFPKERVHFRAGATNKRKIERETGNSNAKPTKAIALAYIDARDVMDRLDEVVGSEYWQDSYEETSSGRVICTLSINFPGIGWISKSDGAGDTGTEGEKGAISDAFKRAAVKFGIGRYLYSFPNEWYDYDGWKFSVKEFKFPKGATEKEWKLSQSHKIDKETMQQSLVALVTAIDSEDSPGAKEVMSELNEDEQGYIWRLLSTKQKEVARKLAQQEAA